MGRTRKHRGKTRNKRKRKTRYRSRSRTTKNQPKRLIKHFINYLF